MPMLWRIMSGILLSLWFWTVAGPAIAAPADASSQSSQYQSNQAMSQPASLVAPDPEMEINIYPQPDTRKSRIGYGLNGDAVRVLEQTGSNGGTVWNRIQFEQTPDSEGWVQLEYLSIQSPDQQVQGNQPRSPGGYMGGSKSQQRSSGQAQTYYQQDQQQNY